LKKVADDSMEMKRAMGVFLGAAALAFAALGFLGGTANADPTSNGSNCQGVADSSFTAITGRGIGYNLGGSGGHLVQITHKASVEQSCVAVALPLRY
jgi:hypothetical protein